MGAVLGAVGEKRLLPRLDVRGDVHNKRGANVGVEGGVKDFERPVWGAVFWRKSQAGKAGEEAGLIAEGGRGVMVRVTTLPVGKDDDAGAQAAEHGGDLEAILEGVLDVAVGQIERFAVGDAEDAGSLVGLGFALGRRAAGAALAAGEVKDAGAGAESLLDEQGATAGLLNVVTVGCDSEDVDDGFGVKRGLRQGGAPSAG